LRRIKRTKITVIRTETVFLKKQTGDLAKDLLKLQAAAFSESEPAGTILEAEVINRTEGSEQEGEIK